MSVNETVNMEQTSFAVITAAVCFAHAKYNLIIFKLWLILPAVNNISGSANSNSNKPIKFVHL